MSLAIPYSSSASHTAYSSTFIFNWDKSPHSETTSTKQLRMANKIWIYEAKLIMSIFYIIFSRVYFYIWTCRAKIKTSTWMLFYYYFKIDYITAGFLTNKLSTAKSSILTIIYILNVTINIFFFFHTWKLWINKQKMTSGMTGELDVNISRA